MKRMLVRSLVLVVLLAPVSILTGRDLPSRLTLSSQDIEPVLGTHWYGIYLQGKKIGYAKDQLARTAAPDKPGYVSTLHVKQKLVIAGVKTDVEETEAFEFENTSPFAMRRARSSEKEGQSTQIVELVRTAKGFDVAITTGGTTTTKPMPLFDYSLADAISPSVWVRRVPQEGDRLTINSFDFDELKLNQEIRKVVAVKNGAFEVEVTLPKKEITLPERYDAHGVLVFGKSSGGYDLRLEPEHQAKKIEYSSDLFHSASVKIDKPLGNATKLANLIMEVAGLDGPYLKDGPRQAVVQTPSGIFICKTGPAFGTPLKATPKDIEENLAETTTYPINHAKVRVLLAEALGDAKTPKEKVERLVHFVARYITADDTGPQWTLFEVLEGKKGACNEYALLFTTLARAAGIPARDVSGLIYMGDAKKTFGPHAWNEVVLDECWVPVDAGWDEVEINPTHIRSGSGVRDDLNWQKTEGKLSFKLIEVQKKPGK